VHSATEKSKKFLGKHLKEVYGETLSHYCIVAEKHASSSRQWERTYHWHALLKLSRRVKWRLVASKLRGLGLWGHLSFPQLHADYFRVLRYLLVPSLNKGPAELDDNPYFSSKFPLEVLDTRMKKFFQATFRPSDMYQIAKKHGFTSFTELCDWAKLQSTRGNKNYELFLARQGPKMKPLFDSWKQLLSDPPTARSQRAQRLQLFHAAAASPCSCVTPNRLRAALRALLLHHNKDEGRWAFGVMRLLHLGTSAKNANMLLYGESNSGKTGLTRRLIHIFEDKCFLRPNAGDSFPLQGLENYLVSVWQDFRVATSPVPWDSLLLALEGESVTAAVKGAAPVIVHFPPPFVVTSQSKIVPRTKRGEPDEAERLAWNNRFGLRWHFRLPIPQDQRDSRLKLCYGCKGCYARWVNDSYSRYIEENPGVDEELKEFATALDAVGSSTAAASSVAPSAPPASDPGPSSSPVGFSPAAASSVAPSAPPASDPGPSSSPVGFSPAAASSMAPSAPPALDPGPSSSPAIEPWTPETPRSSQTRDVPTSKRKRSPDVIVTHVRSRRGLEEVTPLKR